MTRQMKTITYSLASTKCMEEGWTVRPESPSSMDTEQFHDPFVIEVNPLQLVSTIYSAFNKHRSMTNEKRLQIRSNKSATIFPKLK